MKQPPQGFIGGGSFYDRQQQAPVQAPPKVHEVAPPRVVASGPANAEPLLSITYAEGDRSKGSFCTLSKPLVARLLEASRLTQPEVHKTDRYRVHIVVPKSLNGQWYLDINPRLGVGTDFSLRAARFRFRIEPVSKRHFLQARPFLAAQPGAPFKGNANVFVSRLHFRLGGPVPGHPGYHYLEPLTRPVHH